MSNSAARRRAGMARRRTALWGSAFLVGVVLSLASYRPARPDPGGAESASYLGITFRDLSSFKYVPTSRRRDLPPGATPFPPEVQALHGKRVTISGFMQPMYVQEGKTREFFISRGGVGCCFADAPQQTEIVQVKLPPERAVPVTNVARVWGTLEVKEELDQQGYPLSLYRMAGDWVRAEGEGATSPGQVAANACMIAVVIGAILEFIVNLVLPWFRVIGIGDRASFLRPNRKSTSR